LVILGCLFQMTATRKKSPNLRLPAACSKTVGFNIWLFN